MDYKNLLLSVEDGVALISFNRPKALNALNSDTLKELIDAVGSVNSDESVSAVILTGEGEKAFIAGADISEMKDLDPGEAKEFLGIGHKACRSLETMDKPVIAAVNGFALGGGTEVALACDFVYASENAKFGLPEVTLGIFPGFGGTQRLARQVGKAKARELIYTGGMIDAEEACKIGLANKVFPHEELLAEAKKTASQIGRNGTEAVKLAKSVINKGYDLDIEKGCDLELEIMSRCFSTDDQKKRMAAFLEKRKKK